MWLFEYSKNLKKNTPGTGIVTNVADIYYPRNVRINNNWKHQMTNFNIAHLFGFKM